MKENYIEKKLRKRVQQAGGRCIKCVCPGTAGMPDRLVLFPGGRLAFVELKAPGKKPRPLQLVRHTRLKNLGFSVFVLDRPEKIDEVIHEIYTAYIPENGY